MATYSVYTRGTADTTTTTSIEEVVPIALSSNSNQDKAMVLRGKANAPGKVKSTHRGSQGPEDPPGADEHRIMVTGSC